MDIINSVLKYVVNLVSSLLPVLGVSPEFMQKIDNAIVMVINFMSNANYFLPLDTVILCFTTLLTFDLARLSFRIVQWIISFIRG